MSSHHHKLSGIYVLMDPATRRDYLSVLSQLQNLGIHLFQLRSKGACSEQIETWLNEIMPVLNSSVVMINDHWQFVAAHGLSGVHLGPNDATPAFVRGELGGSDRVVIGASGDDASRLQDVRNQTADYFGVGTFRQTASKPDAGKPIGLEGLRDARNLTDKPIFAIGGILPEDLAEIRRTGVDGVAVYAGIWLAENPITAATAYLQAWEK